MQRPSSTSFALHLGDTQLLTVAVDEAWLKLESKRWDNEISMGFNGNIYRYGYGHGSIPIGGMDIHK